MAMGYVVMSLIALGQGDRARELAKRAMLLDPDNLTLRYNFACGFVELKDTETALNLLGAVLEKDTLETVNWAKVDPDLDALRDHPRFKAMIEGAETRLAMAVG
jgi:adenylate cyclase